MSRSMDRRAFVQLPAGVERVPAEGRIARIRSAVYFQGIEQLKFSDGSTLELQVHPNDPLFPSSGTWRSLDARHHQTPEAGHCQPRVSPAFLMPAAAVAGSASDAINMAAAGCGAGASFEALGGGGMSASAW